MTNDAYQLIVDLAKSRVDGEREWKALVPKIVASMGRRAANAANNRSLAREFVRIEKGVDQIDITEALWIKTKVRATQSSWLELRLFLLKHGTTLPRWDLLRAEYQGFLPKFFDFQNGIATDLVESSIKAFNRASTEMKLIFEQHAKNGPIKVKAICAADASGNHHIQQQRDSLHNNSNHIIFVGWQVGIKFCTCKRIRM